MEAKTFFKALFPATFFGLVARKPQHIRKKKPLVNKTEDGFWGFPLHWSVQREKGTFCALSDTWVGVESGKHIFFYSHTQKNEKKKKSLLNPQTRGAGAKPSGKKIWQNSRETHAWKGGNMNKSEKLCYIPFYPDGLTSCFPPLLSMFFFSILSPCSVKGTTTGPGWAWAVCWMPTPPLPKKWLQPISCHGAIWMIFKPLQEGSRGVGCWMQAAAANPSLQCHSIIQNCQMHITTAVLLLNRKKLSVMGLDAPFILFLFYLILLTKDILWGQDLFISGEV